MTSFIVAPPNVPEESILSAYDDVIADLAKRGPDASELTRVQAKMRSDLYGELEIPIQRASALAHAVLFDGNADRVKSAPEEIAAVTANDVRAFAAKYLTKANRTIIYRAPETHPATGATGVPQ
jgi:zinc protease